MYVLTPRLAVYLGPKFKPLSMKVNLYHPPRLFLSLIMLVSMNYVEYFFCKIRKVTEES
jgi:hypothetical protein